MAPLASQAITLEIEYENNTGGGQEHVTDTKLNLGQIDKRLNVRFSIYNAFSATDGVYSSSTLTRNVRSICTLIMISKGPYISVQSGMKYVPQQGVVQGPWGNRNERIYPTIYPFDAPPEQHQRMSSSASTCLSFSNPSNLASRLAVHVPTPNLPTLRIVHVPASTPKHGWL